MIWGYHYFWKHSFLASDAEDSGTNFGTDSWEDSLIVCQRRETVLFLLVCVILLLQGFGSAKTIEVCYNHLIFHSDLSYYAWRVFRNLKKKHPVRMVQLFDHDQFIHLYIGTNPPPRMQSSPP